MEFDESIRYMEGLLRFGWKLGNERMEALCARLGNPQDRYSVIHVAGTKGKGSTTALAAAILREAGYTTGSYFSPYVYDVRERAQMDGTYISREDFARIVTEIRPHIEALAETEFGQTTEFELKTALAFRFFGEKCAEFACIEVGIGGRLDATNIVHPVATVITNIGLDHVEILGDTHGKIAAEKGGIMKPNVPCFTATDNLEALEVLTAIAQERHAPLVPVKQVRPIESISETVAWVSAGHTAPLTVATPTNIYRDMGMRMGGLYQRANAACAIAAAEYALATQSRLLPEEAVRQALATTALPGRLTTVRAANGVLVVLDGAHNALAAEALANVIKTIKREYTIRNIYLVIGMVGGHSPEGLLTFLAPLAQRIFACQPNWKRAIAAETIAEVATTFTDNVEIVHSPLDAAHAAISYADAMDMVLVTGSFYTVGEVPLSAFSS